VDFANGSRCRVLDGLKMVFLGLESIGLAQDVIFCKCQAPQSGFGRR
jgi:hypothetical protein